MYNPGLPNYGYGMVNPYMATGNVVSQPQPVPQMGNQSQIVRVHGQDGAKAYALAPNSSILLMDETDNIVWCKVSDGAGFCTLKGFRISPLEDEKVVAVSQPEYVLKDDFMELKNRFEKIEEAFK